MVRIPGKAIRIEDEKTMSARSYFDYTTRPASMTSNLR
jgi:hypothetical protein